jgi:hypothetical protein
MHTIPFSPFNVRKINIDIDMNKYGSEVKCIQNWMVRYKEFKFPEVESGISEGWRIDKGRGVWIRW